MLLTDSCIFEEIRAEVNTLPSKLNFKIGEAAKILGVETHVLRYWEEEFALLKPKKFSNNQRLYFKKDMEILFLIKILLYEEKLKVQGARKYLSKFYHQFKKEKLKNTKAMNPQSKVVKKEVKSLLKDIHSFRSQIGDKDFL